MTLTNLDENSYHLSNYEHNQSLLEQQWENSLPNKREAVIEYAIKIMEGLVDKKEFNYVFHEFYEDSDFDGDIYTDAFEEALDNWNMGIAPSCELESEMLWKIAFTALDGASHILYDIDFEDLFDYLNSAIKKVINNDN